MSKPAVELTPEQLEWVERMATRLTCRHTWVYGRCSTCGMADTRTEEKTSQFDRATPWDVHHPDRRR